MGLIKSAVKAIGSELHDQWKDFIRCEDMDMNTLMVKKTTPNGVISKGSGIIVGPGQIAVLYDQGKILDATAEEGVYTFDSNTSPSFFAGQFGDVFKDMWTRFTYGGVAAKDQAVFFINSKEIMDNKFGTQTPIPCYDFDHIIPNEMTGGTSALRVDVRCYGNYTFKIVDPAVFMKEYAGTGEVVTKEVITDQIRSEVIDVLKSVINELGSDKYKVGVVGMPSQTGKIKEIMTENVYDEGVRRRGLQIVALVIESVTPTEESVKKIDEYEHNSNSRMQQGRVLDVMDHAASNSNGAANGFMGLGMMNMGTGGMAGGVMQNAFTNNTTSEKSKQTEEKTESSSASKESDETTSTSEGPKFCSNCGNELKGAKFCPNCGTKVE